MPAAERACPLVIVEGCETALSAWCARGLPTHAILRSLAQADPPDGSVLLRDDDAIGSPADRALEKRAAEWRASGIRFVMVTPSAERRQDKGDFNNLLQADGIVAERARLRAAELELQGFTTVPAPFALPTATIEDARQVIERGLDTFRRLALAEDETPPRMLLAGESGIGKTEAIGRRLGAEIQFDKAKREAHRHHS